jgi:hypothetical protein
MAAGPPKAPEWVGVRSPLPLLAEGFLFPGPIGGEITVQSVANRASRFNAALRARLEDLRDCIRLNWAQPARVTLPQPLTLTPVTLDLRIMRATSERIDTA